MSKKLFTPLVAMVFEVGDSYKNLSGEFNIESVDNDKVMIRYVDGVYAGNAYARTHMELTKEIKRLNLKNLRENRMIELNLLQPDEAFTLGFFAGHGVIHIRLNPANQLAFEALYNQLTGVNAPVPNEVYYFVREDRADVFKLMFPLPDDEILSHMAFGNGRLPLDTEFGGQYHNKNYILNMFRMGFRIGPNKNRIDEIRKHISDECMEHFEKGLVYHPKDDKVTALEIETL